MSDYGDFRVNLIKAVLSEGLTPAMVADRLAEYAREHQTKPDLRAAIVAEVETLYERGARWDRPKPT